MPLNKARTIKKDSTTSGKRVHSGRLGRTSNPARKTANK